MPSPILILLLTACHNEPTTGSVVAPEPLAQRELLPADSRLVRASIALRGQRPTAVELDRIAADPDALEAMVDEWLVSPAFGEVIKDMHAELLLTRTDADNQLPSVGLAADYTTNQIHEATAEEPLELVRYVVENDRPYTELVTADYMLANEVTATLYGVERDAGTSGWQPARWADGRPHAGVLSSSQLFRRHVSAGSNFHRLRANFLAEVLLCESFAKRDLVVDGGVDLTDEAAVARAVRENPNCIGCHQALDPLAATLWGFKRQIDPRAVEQAYDLDDCVPDPDKPQPPIDEGDLPTDYCYPLVMYTPSKEDRWSELDLRAPGFYGEPVADLADLGQQIAQDPRFAQCAVRHFYGWFTQQAPDDVPLSTVAELAEVFEASDYSARELSKAIVLSEAFAAVRPVAPGDAPLLSVRPEAYADIVEQHTGFRWIIDPIVSACEPTCWSEVDLSVSDKWGYRSMAGGIDGYQVMQPTHTASPNKVLVTQRLAAEAASYVVQHDVRLPAAERLLLTLVEPSTVDEATVRAQLEALHHRILGEAATTPEDIDEAYVLFDDTLTRTGDTEHAWTVSIALLLQDPRLIYY